MRAGYLGFLQLLMEGFQVHKEIGKLWDDKGDVN